MDKKIINEEQFRKLVVNEAKKLMSEEANLPMIEEGKIKRKITFDKVESLIKEMENSNKSITSINLSDELYTDKEEVIKESKEEKNKPNRNLDVLEHNRKKDFKHINEGEKDKWNRMLNYEIPSDEDR